MDRFRQSSEMYTLLQGIVPNAIPTFTHGCDKIHLWRHAHIRFNSSVTIYSRKIDDLSFSFFLSSDAMLPPSAGWLTLYISVWKWSFSRARPMWWNRKRNAISPITIIIVVRLGELEYLTRIAWHWWCTALRVSICVCVCGSEWIQENGPLKTLGISPICYPFPHRKCSSHPSRRVTSSRRVLCHIAFVGCHPSVN